MFWHNKATIYNYVNQNSLTVGRNLITIPICKFFLPARIISPRKLAWPPLRHLVHPVCFPRTYRITFTPNHLALSITTAIEMIIGLDNPIYQFHSIKLLVCYRHLLPSNTLACLDIIIQTLS